VTLTVPVTLTVTVHVCDSGRLWRNRFIRV
jgi:hypothetical protein